MSLNEEERQIIVTLEMEKALRIFSQISGLAQLGYWDNVANRLYYALFHAVSALLIHDGHRVSTHKGLSAIFGQSYVKAGVFAPEDGRLYSQLQSMREKSDYNCTYEAGEDEIRPKIAQTERLIDKIRIRLQQASVCDSR